MWTSLIFQKNVTLLWIKKIEEIILRVNIHISANGLQGKHTLPDEFPYKAMNPMSVKEQTFNSIEDIHEVLIECYDKCVSKVVSEIGKALYQQSLFICNDTLLLDNDSHKLIKKYQFCKSFNCPPYPSLQDTPANIMESFMIIDKEIKSFSLGEVNGN